MNIPELLQQLREEREKNAALEMNLRDAWAKIVKLQAELAEAKEELDERQQTSWKQAAIIWQEKANKVEEMLRDMTSPNCQCDACCSARDYFAVSS